MSTFQYRPGFVGTHVWFTRKRWVNLHADSERMAAIWDDLATWPTVVQIRIKDGVTELWLAHEVAFVETGGSTLDSPELR